MSATYTKRQITAQKKDIPSVSSVLDASSQSESLQRKANMANSAAQRAEAPRPNNTGMPDNLKSGIESLSGFSMDDVRVHYNSSKPATVQALAYTQGTDIHVAPGQEKHLPHEAWHVAQQMAGRVSPTTNINGMPVNDNAGLEHEADIMGEKAVQCKSDVAHYQKAIHSTTPIQCYKKVEEFVVSNSGKYAVKENEASTVYIREDVNASDEGVQNLQRLGIKSDGKKKACSGSNYKVFKQHKRTVGKVEKSLLPFNEKVDNIELLQEHEQIIQNLINVCSQLKNRSIIQDKTTILNYDENPNGIFNKLGKDILNDFKIIKKWLNNNYVDNGDMNLLNIVLEDLLLRKSQIRNEIGTRKPWWKKLWTRLPFSTDYAALKTQCGIFADQIRTVFPNLKPEKLGLEIISPDEDSIWENHYSVKIANDDSDILCIEDAAGKSSGPTALANAHWFARLYGENKSMKKKEGKILILKNPTEKIDFDPNSTRIFKDKVLTLYVTYSK